MSEKHKKVSRALNYFKHFLVFVSTVSGCVSNSAFASLIAAPVGTVTSAVGLKICIISAGIKKYKLMIWKKVEKAWWNSVASKDEIRYNQSFDI